jgi:hypothetical protein
VVRVLAIAWVLLGVANFAELPFRNCLKSRPLMSQA